MEMPGAGQLAAASAACRACSSVSNSRIENPWPSAGSSQYPAAKPGAEVTSGKMSSISAAAAAGACPGSIVTVTSAACIVFSLVSRAKFVLDHDGTTAGNSPGARPGRGAPGGIWQELSAQLKVLPPPGRHRMAGAGYGWARIWPQGSEWSEPGARASSARDPSDGMITLRNILRPSRIPAPATCRLLARQAPRYRLLRIPLPEA